MRVQKPRTIPGMSLQKATKEIATAIADAAWIDEEAAYSGFVFEQPDGSHTYNYLGSLSWTNGLAVAVPMLLSGLRLQEERIRGQAVRAIQNIVDNCMNPASGLPYDAVQHRNWNLNGWWYDIMYIGGHSGYIVGQALYYILKAYDYEKRLNGVEHADWLAMVTPVIERLQKTKNGEQEYPFVLSEETGAGIAYDSLGSSWCLAASAYYCVLTGDKSLLAGMQESEQRAVYLGSAFRPSSLRGGLKAYPHGQKRVCILRCDDSLCPQSLRNQDKRNRGRIYYPGKAEIPLSRRDGG